MVQSVTICVSYILNALFRDTPLAYFFVPPGHLQCKNYRQFVHQQLWAKCKIRKLHI